MSDWLQFWPLFPAAVAIASLALTFSIGGAAFFSPLFLVLFPALGWKALPPQYAFTAALATQLAGFTSGSIGYARRGLVDYYSAIPLLLLALIGILLRHWFMELISGQILLLILASGFFGLGMYGLYAYLAKRNVFIFKMCFPKAYQPLSPSPSSDALGSSLNDTSMVELHDVSTDKETKDINAGNIGSEIKAEDKVGLGDDEDQLPLEPSPSAHSHFSIDSIKHKIFSEREYLKEDGSTGTYLFSFPLKAALLVGFGALSTGFRSIGISEAAATVLTIMCSLPQRQGQATAVLVAAITIWVTVLLDFALLGSRMADFPWAIVGWMAPGVLIGAQLGSFVAAKLPSQVLEGGRIVIYFLLSLIVAIVAFTVSGAA